MGGDARSRRGVGASRLAVYAEARAAGGPSRRGWARPQASKEGAAVRAQGDSAGQARRAGPTGAEAAGRIPRCMRGVRHVQGARLRDELVGGHAQGIKLRLHLQGQRGRRREGKQVGRSRRDMARRLRRPGLGRARLQAQTHWQGNQGGRGESGRQATEMGALARPGAEGCRSGSRGRRKKPQLLNQKT